MQQLDHTHASRREFTKVTIVTVVLNNSQHIGSTIQSVLEQTYCNKEYIIVDGGSTDGTLDEINRFASCITKIVCEPDQGVYDAMNKAIRLASGEWIVFMNAGDQFFEKETLLKVFSRNYPIYKTIVYGDSHVLYPSGRIRCRRSGGTESLWRGSQFSHQSSFSRLTYHVQHEFILSDGIAADFGFFYRAWKNNVVFEKLNFPVSIVRSGGISDTHRLEVIRKWSNIVNPSPRSTFNFRCQILREHLLRIVKRAMLFLGVRQQTN